MVQKLPKHHSISLNTPKEDVVASCYSNKGREPEADRQRLGETWKSTPVALCKEAILDYCLGVTHKTSFASGKTEVIDAVAWERCLPV